jgi:D-alanyl-D-alanine carboxypeptidase
MIFSAKKIPTSLAHLISRYSWNPRCPTPLEDLRYLTLSHYGFDEKIHQGELIVHKNVSHEVLEIFKILLKERFPIEKMRLIDHYEANDLLSMQDNNSSGFCFREAVCKPGILSKHSFGLAIDINPLYNPYIRDALILPPEGARFLNRKSSFPGKIDRSSACYRAFIAKGWKWGGNFHRRKDYHHFERAS